MTTTILDRRHAAALLGATAACLLQACAQPTLMRGEEGVAKGGMTCKFGISTCVAVLKPPVIIEAAGLRTVGVAAGQSRGSDALALQFESRLSKVRVNDLPYYTVVPASDPKRDGVYEITATTLTNSESQVSESRCPPRKILCKSSEMRPVTCTVRKGNAAATLRLRKPDGRVLATRQESATAEAKMCAGETAKVLEPGELLAQATDTLSEKLQDLAAMSAELQPVRVMDDASQIKDAGRRQRFVSALAFSKAGRLDRSCPVYEELIEIERNSVALYYNTAFCVQAKGDWRRANALCRQADTLTTAPSKEVQQCIQETQLSAAQAAG